MFQQFVLSLGVHLHISLGILFIFSFGYIYTKHVYGHWTRRGIEIAHPPAFLIGNFGKILMQKCTIGELMQDFYNSSTQPVVGVYAGLRAMLIPRDPQLVRNILNNDFAYFHDRGMYCNVRDDPLTGQLLMTPGEKWKQMRAKLTPTFTSGKLKAMCSTLIDCAQPLQQHLEQYVDRAESAEIRDICTRFTMNIIVSTAFGIDIDCFARPDEVFLRQGRKFFELTLNNLLRQLLSSVAPGLMKFLRMRLFDKEMCEFMIAMVEQNLKHREEQKIVRKDFFQLLVQIRNGGNVQQDGDWTAKISNDSTKKNLSIEEVAANAYLFLIAGYESSSASMSFVLYELSKNHEVQDKVHAEIDQVLGKFDGQVTYDSLKELKYLDCCIDESLRKYPPLPAMFRECTKDYIIPGTSFTITKGTPLMIPVWALHYDEQFWSEPQQFRPERFADGNRKSFNEMPFLGFGDGPRACIGIRMGRMQTKIGLIAMLRKYRFEIGDELRHSELKISPKNFITAPSTGIFLKVKQRF